MPTNNNTNGAPASGSVPKNLPPKPSSQNGNQSGGKPFYIQTWFIGLMYSLWFLCFIPLVAGILLTLMQDKYDKQLAENYKKVEDIDAYLDSIGKQCDQRETKAEQKLASLKAESNTLRQELRQLNGEVIVASVTIPGVDETISSEEYRSKYSLLLLKEKELVKSEKAVEILDKTISKRVLNNDIKQLLRCFNSEADTHIRSITARNIETIKNRIIKTFEILNKLFETDGIRLNRNLLEIKLEEADLMYSCEYQKEQERMQQKAIREQMIEEEKVRREIEQVKAKVEKEEAHFRNEIDKLMVHLRAASEIEKQLYVDKIRELEAKLKEVEETKKNVLEREQNTRAGYVYIISNIGSFGENIYKIGMTRRLDPLDRVRELGSASVPFEFDVHAMIFSDDAPALENTLHHAFENQRVNMVNSRKEFFHVSLQDIEKVVKENFNATVQFTMVAEAAQFRESQRILERKSEATTA